MAQTPSLIQEMIVKSILRTNFLIQILYEQLSDPPFFISFPESTYHVRVLVILLQPIPRLNSFVNLLKEKAQKKNAQLSKHGLNTCSLTLKYLSNMRINIVACSG